MKHTTNLLFFVLFTLLFFSACQKDEIEDLTLPDSEFIDDSSILSSTTRTTGDECKEKMFNIQREFESIYYTSSLNEEVFMANFGVPNWPENDSYCDYFNPDSLIILPLVSLLDDKEIQSLLVVDKITRASEYSFTVIGKYQFLEVLDKTNPDSIPESVTQLVEFFNYFKNEMSSSNSSADNVATIRCGPGEGCGPSGWQKFWSSVRRFVNRITSGGGGGGGSGGGSSTGNGGAYISPGTITFWNNTSPSTGGNNIPGGGSNSGNEPALCTSEKDALTFEELELVLDNLARYYNEFGISDVYGVPLIDLLQPGCINIDYIEFKECANKSIACHYGLDSENYRYMRHFLNEYQLEDLSTLADVVGNCGSCFSQESYDEYAFEQLAEYYSSLIDKENFDAENSAFEYKTLSCESFIFTDQLDGSGQIACVDELFLTKVFAHTGAFSYTSQFCVHVTMPKVRHDGIVVPYGRAQDCAAWAANEAAALVGFAFARSNYQMFDDVMIALFRTTFNVQIKKSSCGYGSMTTCDNPNVTCAGEGPNPAEWIEGFFDFIEESLFGCF